MPQMATTAARTKATGLPGMLKAGGIAVALVILFLLAPYFTGGPHERNTAAPIQTVMIG